MATAAVSSLSPKEGGIFFKPCIKQTSAREMARPIEQARRQELENVCRSHTKKIFQVIYRITKNREDAEDALQDALLQAFVHLDKFDGRSAFSTWLTRIAINSALMLLRKRRNSHAFSLDGMDDAEGTEAFLQIPDRAPDPQHQCLEQERENAVREAIQKLRPSLRRVVELQELEECSLKETAKIMSISVPAAKGRLFHAKRALRKSPNLKVLCGRGREKRGTVSLIGVIRPIGSRRSAQRVEHRRALVA